MKRSQSLPIGFFIAGICFACICALALMTIWFYTPGQTETMSPLPDLSKPGLSRLAAPVYIPEQVSNTDDGPISLAGYIRQDEDKPQTPIDLIKAARNISANAEINRFSGMPGYSNNKSDGRSSGFNAQSASNSSGGDAFSFPNDRQKTATIEDIEADRQWLLSLEMNETPDQPILESDATHGHGMQPMLESETQYMAIDRNPVSEPATDRKSADRTGTAKEKSGFDESILHIAESSPPNRETGLVQLSSQSPQRISDSLDMSPSDESPVALSDKVQETETGVASPLSPNLDLFPTANEPADDDSRQGESGATASAAHASQGKNSSTIENEVQVDNSQKNATPAFASIGDQLTGTEVYTLGDQAASPSQVPSQPDESKSVPNQQSQVTGWPLPTSLLRELAEWKSATLTSHWAAAVESTILQLNNTRIDDPESLEHILYCEQLADQLNQHARTLPRGQELLASRMNRFSLRMKRRFAIWTAVHKISLTQLSSTSSSHSKTLAQSVNQRRISIDNSGVPAEWIEYLMLDKAAEVFESSKATDLHRQTTARKIMGRVSSPALTDEQVLYAQQLIGDELGNLLRDAASGDINPGQFLNDLESFEDGDSAIAEALINNHFQTFYWSRHSKVQELAAVFDENYRNANFQIEISDRLINNILPRNMTVNQPVHDRILGAQVFGNSRVQNQVSVELIPDPHRLSFRLISNGNVLSRTMAHSSGFVFNSLSNAMINASKGISIGTEGVDTMPTDVEADAHSKLLNVRSRVDNVPLVGWMARQVAEQKQQEQSQKANLIVEQKLRNEFGSRVDQEIQTSVDKGRLWVKQNIVDPFNAMELEPMIANMHTTNSAAIVRYRLAGLDQNASNTVQPRSLPGSLVGVQIHESAINNIINRIGINGQTFTAPQFMQHISALLGRTDVELGAGEYEDVKFQFASRDSVRLDFDEDRVAITLRIKRLQIGRTKLWKNLTVTAWYIPRATGLHIDMVLDPDKTVSLAGQDLGLGDQLAVRTVFNALFKPSFDFPLLSPDLASRPAARGIGVSQIVLVDGWAGLSVSEYGPNQQSQVHQPAMFRNARILQNRWR